MNNLFPNIMILLSVLAGISSCWKSEYGLAVYWFCAAMLNFSVTYMIGKF